MIADHVVIALTVAGLIAALVMLVLLLESIQQQTKPGELYPSDVTKPALFYIAHAIQIVLLLGAAFVALISTDPRGIEPGYFWRFGLFMAAAVLICSVPDARKAKAVKAALEGPVTPQVPASILQQHERATVYLDPDSAKLLTK